jgi:hypothetical protein
MPHDRVPDQPRPGPAAARVSAQDVNAAVRLAVLALRGAPAGAWDAKAGGLDWDCWETGDHLCDDLFSYAIQLGPPQPPLDREVPLAWERRRPGGPANAIRADRAAGPAGLLQVLEGCGSLLAAMVATTPDTVRAHHVFGLSDPEGFAAMGIVEILVHTHDLAGGLRFTWSPPAELCARVLARLFPAAPPDAEPWAALLWCTGRAALPGRPRLPEWRWDGRPRAEAARGPAAR